MTQSMVRAIVVGLTIIATYVGMALGHVNLYWQRAPVSVRCVFRHVIRHMKLTRLALYVFISVGCIGARVSQESTSSSSQLDQLAHAQAKWQSSKIEAYEIQVQYACNALIPIAPPGVSSRLRFRVTDGESRLLGANETETRVPGDLVQYSTVEEMFAFIRKARTTHPVRIEAQYDEVRGYPTRVCVDPATTTDDEFGFVTSDFKVLRLRK